MDRPTRLHWLNTEYDGELPGQFTNPFCYEPHPLCIEAAKEVQAELHKHADWMADASHGKMFGVMIVSGEGCHQVNAEHQAKGVWFLAAFSGLLNRQNDIDYFVPPIYDILDSTGHFQQEQAEISKMSEEIRRLEGDGNMDSHPEDYTRLERVAISALKRLRKQRSETLQDWLFNQYTCMNALGEEKIIAQIFKDFYREKMLNKEDYEENERKHHIPSGSGECCAPKLLQYAYKHHLHPLSMAEFWIGKPPKDEVRHHGQFYPACTKKCRPLLHFMLKGLNVEESFLDRHNRELLNQVDILYEDEDIVVINKPSGLLSVPSRDTQASVIDWARMRYPDISRAAEQYQANYPAPVHRLDQDTSGVLIVAKNRESLRNMQYQFYCHKVHKTYLALLDGRPEHDSGTITLPLRKDSIDAPRQVVDYEHGKNCVTRYEVLDVLPREHEGDDYISHEEAFITRVAFYPETGRTHQLRMHAAHQDGLGCPIIGDKLYGKKRMFVHPSNYQSLLWPRLMLHASSIEFAHPITQQPMRIECPPPF